MPKRNKLSNADLRSEEVQEILSFVPSWMIRWGNVVFLYFIIMLLFISWYVEYPDIIVARTLLTTEIPPQKVYAKTTAKIDTIFVKENQSVYEGQPLAVLENTADFEDIFFLKSILDTINLKNGNFEFPINQIPILFLGDIDSKYSVFQNSYVQYKLNKQLQPYAYQLIANKISLSELQNRLNILLKQQDLKKTALDFKEKDLNRYRTLFEKGIISAQEYENRQLDFLEAEQRFKNLSISISQTYEAIAFAQKTSKGTSIEKTLETVRLFKKVVQSFNQLKIAIETWERQYVLTSEINGKVAFMGYWSDNQSASRGNIMFTIIPAENSAYVAKLKIPEQNSGKVQISQNVKINLKNFPETEFGVLQGKVQDISILPNSDGFYLVDVSLPKELVTSYGKKIKFKHEMSGTANIITEDLRLVERFFYQLRDLFGR